MSTRTRRRRTPAYAPKLAWLMVAAIALHGPFDLLITITHTHLESNPVVLSIGWPAWLVIKALTIPMAALIWFELRREPRTQPLAWALAILLTLLGVALILPNILVVMGVIG